MTSEVISIVYVFLVIFYFVWKGILLHIQSLFNLLSYQSSQKQWRQLNSSSTSWKLTSNNAWYIVPSAKRMPRRWRGISGFGYFGSIAIAELWQKWEDHNKRILQPMDIENGGYFRCSRYPTSLTGASGNYSSTFNYNEINTLNM